MATFVVHNLADNVGVAVIDIEPGQVAEGVVLDGGQATEVKSRDRVPLGHKIALRDLKEGDTVIKYGEDIGRAVADIYAGDHVHVHNLKTKRW